MDPDRPLQSRRFEATTTKAMMAIADPSDQHPLSD